MRSPGQVAGGVLELTCSIIQDDYYETNHCEVIAGLTLNKLKLKDDIACQLCNSLISLPVNPLKLLFIKTRRVKYPSKQCKIFNK